VPGSAHAATSFGEPKTEIGISENTVDAENLEFETSSGGSSPPEASQMKLKAKTRPKVSKNVVSVALSAESTVAALGVSSLPAQSVPSTPADILSLLPPVPTHTAGYAVASSVARPRSDVSLPVISATHVVPTVMPIVVSDVSDVVVTKQPPTVCPQVECSVKTAVTNPPNVSMVAHVQNISTVASVPQNISVVPTTAVSPQNTSGVATPISNVGSPPVTSVASVSVANASVATTTATATTSVDVKPVTTAVPVTSETGIPVSTSGVVSPTPTTSASGPPVVVVRQLEQVKPYNGSTSHRSFRNYFERVCRCNQWTTPVEKAQHLSLALDGPAVDCLREVTEGTDESYEQIWAALARRFGYVDEPERAMRRFDARRQQEGETLAEYEQALRTLYREAWPNSDERLKDSSLKRKFEQSLLNPELVQFLRLHTRGDDFAQTVARARQFQDAQELAKPRKPAIRMAETIDHGVGPDHQAAQYQPILDGLKQILDTVLNDRGRPAEVNCVQAATPARAIQATSSGPRRDRSLSGQRQPTSPAPSSTGSNQSSGNRQRSVRFEDQQTGEANRAPVGEQQPSRYNDDGGARNDWQPRYNGQYRSGPRTYWRAEGPGQQPEQGGPRFSAPSSGGRERFWGQRGQPAGQGGDGGQRQFRPRGTYDERRWNNQFPPPASSAPPLMGPPPARPSFGTPPSGRGAGGSSTGRGPIGCLVCGRFGCHSALHRERCHVCGEFGCHTRFHSEATQPSPGMSQQSRAQGPSGNSGPAAGNPRGNEQRGPRQGDRTPQNN